MAEIQKNAETPDLTESRRAELDTASREYEDRLTALLDALGGPGEGRLSPEDRALLQHGVRMLLAQEGVVMDEREE